MKSLTRPSKSKDNHPHPDQIVFFLLGKETFDDNDEEQDDDVDYDNGSDNQEGDQTHDKRLTTTTTTSSVQRLQHGSHTRMILPPR